MRLNDLLGSGLAINIYIDFNRIDKSSTISITLDAICMLILEKSL